LKCLQNRVNFLCKHFKIMITGDLQTGKFLFQGE
jgi:hypothetical protein